MELFPGREATFWRGKPVLKRSNLTFQNECCPPGKAVGKLDVEG